MFPDDFIVAERIESGVAVGSKKRALERLASLLASSSPKLSTEAVFDRLLERERLGSTGLGHGIALPHARMPEADQARGAFIRLEHGIDYDAIDSQPVDLAFAMVVPSEATDEHLQLLAHLATLFDDEGLCAQLRAAETPAVILALLNDHGGHGAELK